jgi:hypothetical protein
MLSDRELAAIRGCLPAAPPSPDFPWTGAERAVAALLDTVDELRERLDAAEATVEVLAAIDEAETAAMETLSAERMFKGLVPLQPGLGQPRRRPPLGGH